MLGLLTAMAQGTEDGKPAPAPLRRCAAAPLRRCAAAPRFCAWRELDGLAHVAFGRMHAAAVSAGPIRRCLDCALDVLVRSVEMDICIGRAFACV